MGLRGLAVIGLAMMEEPVALRPRDYFALDDDPPFRLRHAAWVPSNRLAFRPTKFLVIACSSRDRGRLLDKER